MIRALTVFAASALVVVQGACDNQCSGHGTCQIDDVCNCYDNWGVGLSLDTGDCSDRICPFEIAWVDTPTDVGRFHTYAECSGKGICNRKSGLCECFDGYEGNACKRTTCPNDCSGHGTCEYIEDMAFGVVWNQYTSADFKSDAKQFEYYGWDKGKTRGCVCDSQYSDIDCSKRLCPHGTDVLDVRDNLLVDERAQIQEIHFSLEQDFDDTFVIAAQLQTFALKFRSRLNESFTTLPINFDYNSASTNDFANDIHLALLQLPHQVIDACSVSVDKQSARDVVVRVTFTGDAVQGPQNLLEVIDYKCEEGCTPRVTGLTHLKTAVGVTGVSTLGMLNSSVAEIQLSDLNSYECGRRGKCDYSSGLCECFEGYTGENCNTQTTLV